jgi:hypothetical protein
MSEFEFGIREYLEAAGKHDRIDATISAYRAWSDGLDEGMARMAALVLCDLVAPERRRLGQPAPFYEAFVRGATRLERFPVNPCAGDES